MFISNSLDVYYFDEPQLAYPIVKFFNHTPNLGRTLISEEGSVRVSVRGDIFNTTIIGNSTNIFLTSNSIGEIDYSSMTQVSPSLVEFNVVNISKSGFVEVSATNTIGVTSVARDANWYFNCSEDRLIDLVRFLPLDLQDSETGLFVKFFEDFLNTLYATPEGCHQSILKKIERIMDFNDPEEIDIEYIQFFANAIGYKVNVNRGVIGTFRVGQSEEEQELTPEETLEINKYIRFVVSNLPHWYKMKGTNNAIKILLRSFGVIGSFSSMYSNDYKHNWIYDLEDQPNNIEDNVPKDFFPTPHFKIQVNTEGTPPSWINNVKEISDAIESIRPINTVFEGFEGFFAFPTETIDFYHQTKIEHNIFVDWDGAPRS